MNPAQLESLLAESRRGNRASQHHLYRQFYGLAMSVCIRYARDRQEAEEMCNDGFVRVFLHLESLGEAGAFKAWLRKIMVRCAIDYHRKYHRNALQTDPLETATHFPDLSETAPDALSYEEKLRLMQQLPPMYRLAFNLYAVEGHTTAEIAELLQVAEGTVRANVSKARQRLQQMILAAEQVKQN